MVMQHPLQDMCMKSAQRCIAPTFIIALLLVSDDRAGLIYRITYAP